MNYGLLHHRLGQKQSLPTLVHAPRQAGNYSFPTITTGLTLPKACKPHPNLTSQEGSTPLRSSSEIPPGHSGFYSGSLASLGPEDCYGAAGRAAPGRRCPTTTTPPPVPRKTRGQAARLPPSGAQASSPTWQGRLHSPGSLSSSSQPLFIFPLSQASSPRRVPGGSHTSRVSPGTSGPRYSPAPASREEGMTRNMQDGGGGGGRPGGGGAGGAGRRRHRAARAARRDKRGGASQQKAFGENFR